MHFRAVVEIEQEQLLVDSAEAHRPTLQPVCVTQLHLAVQPHCGRLLQTLEAERVELEGGAAVFGILEDGDSVIRGAAVGRHHTGSPMRLLGEHLEEHLEEHLSI